jgi:flagellar motor component MotA
MKRVSLIPILVITLVVTVLSIATIPTIILVGCGSTGKVLLTNSCKSFKSVVRFLSKILTGVNKWNSSNRLLSGEA